MTTTAAPLVSAADAPPNNSRTLVQPLTAIRHGDVSTVGGKGANLGEMTAAGFPVPPGFVLPIDAYLQFYESNRLGPRIAAELRNIDVDDPASLERTAAAVRALILGGRVPEDLADAIHQGVRRPRETSDPVPARRRAILGHRGRHGAVLLRGDVREFPQRLRRGRLSSTRSRRAGRPRSARACCSIESSKVFPPRCPWRSSCNGW